MAEAPPSPTPTSPPLSPSRQVYDDSLSKTKEICEQVKALQKIQEKADREASQEISAHLADKQRIKAIEMEGVEFKKAADREVKNHLLTKEKLEREDRYHQKTKDALQAAKDDVASMRLQMDAMKVEMEAQRKAFVINVNWAARCTELKTKFDQSCHDYDQLLEQHVKAKSEMDGSLRAQEEFRMKHQTSYEQHTIMQDQIMKNAKELKEHGDSSDDLKRKLAELEEFRAKSAEEEARKKLGSQQALSVLQRSLAKGAEGLKTSSFAGWSSLTKTEKTKRLQKKKAMDRTMKNIASDGLGLLANIFKEWRTEFDKEKRAALLAATKRLEGENAGGNSMAGRSRAIAQMEKQFKGEDFSLMQSCFQGWALGQVARKKKEANHKKASRMIANSGKAMLAEIVGLWNELTAKRRKKNADKASNMAKATRMLADSAQALTANIFTVWWAWIEDVRNKRKSDEAGTAKAMRMMANSGQALMNLCFDSWGKLYGESKKKGEGNKKALRMMSNSSQAMLIGVFQAWAKMFISQKSKAAGTAKAVRMIAASGEALTAAVFQGWAADVRKNRDKNKKIRALEKSFGAQDLGLKMVVFTGWQGYAKVEGRRKRAKELSMKTAIKSITGNQDLIKCHMFLAWARYASFDRTEKVEAKTKELEEALTKAVEEARLALEEELVQARTDVESQAAELEEMKRQRDEEKAKVQGLDERLDVHYAGVEALDKEIALLKVELDESKVKAQQIRAKLGEVGDFLTAHSPRKHGSSGKNSRPPSGRQGSDDKLPRIDGYGSRPSSGKTGAMTAR